MLWLGWFLCLMWLGACVEVIPFFIRRRLDLLTPQQALEGDSPLVSVIVPARNEGEHVLTCLRSLLNQNYPHLEILAVNDRSTDNTGQVMDQLAAEDSRLVPVHINDLPEGWLGKPHAMHVASQKAKGEYLLFTDGDIIFEPNAISHSVAYSKKVSLDHLTLVPRAINDSYAEAAFKTFIFMALLLFIQPQKIRTPNRNRYVGLGTFNLIHRNAYEGIGGHKSLALSVVDDIQLGKRIKQAGFSQDVLIADTYLSLQWHNSVWALVKGLEKNMFAALDFSVVKASLGSLGFLIYLLPYYGLFALPQAMSYGYLASLLFMHGLLGFIGHRSEVGWTVQFFLPISVLLELFALWNSVVRTLMQGGIRWRDTFYSIELLKTGIRQGEKR